MPSIRPTSFVASVFMGKGDVCHAVFNCATTDRGEISHVQWRPIAFACLVSKVIHRFCATRLPKLLGKKKKNRIWCQNGLEVLCRSIWDGTMTTNSNNC